MIKKILFTAVLLLPFVGALHRSDAAPLWVFEFMLQEQGKNTGLTLRQPTALFVDPDKERLYVADSGNNQILAYDKYGTFLRAFDADEQLLVPFDLVRAGNFIWIVEKGKNSLTIIDIEARKVIPNSLFDDERLLYPDRIEMDGETLYVLDKAGGTIYALTEKLDIAQRFACKECDSGFVDFKIRNRNLWALEQKSMTVYRFSLDGSLLEVMPLDRTQLDFPRSLEIDEAGFLYILDRHNGRISIFDREGTYRYSFMGPGEARGYTFYPIELQFDPWGRLCIVDEGNGRVHVYSRR